MKQIGIAVAIVTYSFLTRMALTQGVPLYTADYYLINPEGYLGKSVTLDVGYLRPRDEQRDAGLRQFDARTYNQNQWGGTISVLTPAANPSRLAALCGTQMQYTGAGVKMTLIHGTFSKDVRVTATSFSYRTKPFAARNPCCPSAPSTSCRYLTAVGPIASTARL